MKDDAKFLGLGCGIWLGFLVFILLVGIGVSFVMLKAQHDVLNPQIRQNKIDNPNVTIANKADFHNKLGLIIKADQDIVAQLDLLSQYKPGDPNYDSALRDLAGIKQIRTATINDYNAAADNPDKGKDLDSWMPKHIVGVTIPADPNNATNTLNREIDELQSYNHN